MNANIMNSSVLSQLAVYYTKEKLTVRLSDYSNVYLLPAICLFGVSTNMANLIVIFQIKTSDHILNYILVNSLVDLVFLLTQFFLVIIRCGTLCPYGYTYLAKTYDLYVYMFLGYVLNTFQAIFNFYMSLKRLCLFFATRALEKACFGLRWALVVFLLVAFIFNTPSYLIARSVVPIGVYKSNASAFDEEILYDISLKSAFKSKQMQIMLTIVIIIKNPLLYAATGLVNVMIGIKFQQFMQKKKKILKTSSRGVFK
jgi:hypothetical protein